MPAKSNLKLWLSMTTCAAAVAGGTAVAYSTQADEMTQPAQITSAGGEAGSHAGGEGGEGGEGGGEGGEGGEGGGGSGPFGGLSSDQSLAARLHLMRGHLRIGEELYHAGKAADAQPHFMHPLEEIYPDIHEELEEQGTDEEFERRLKDLMSASRGDDAGKFDAALAEVRSSINNAEKSIAAAREENPVFGFEVAVSLLEIAAEEYEASLHENRIVNVVEYQDSLGFVLEAEDILQADADAYRRSDSEAFERVMAALGDLKKAWPTTEPPHQAAMTHGEVLADISRINLLKGRFR
jgi:hypothetical protein